MLPRKVSLLEVMPPSAEVQKGAGMCAAYAVTALVEYAADFKTRLSPAFLFAAMRMEVGGWLERNLTAVMRGERGDDSFERVFADNLAGLRCVLAENPGDSAAAARYVEMFRTRALKTFEVERGCPVRFASEALVKHGICRYELWPSGGDGLPAAFGGAMPVLPQETCVDAVRRRLANGLDFLPEPRNVEAVKAVIAGAGGRRRMPVVLALAADEHHAAHAVLAVGYRDDPSMPGGGEFVVRDAACAEPSVIDYAAVASRCTEAVTVLQLLVDYEGDGYGGQRKFRRLRRAAFAVALAAVVAAAGVASYLTWSRRSVALDAPFEWLVHPSEFHGRVMLAVACDMKDISSFLQFKSFFIRRDVWTRVELHSVTLQEKVRVAVSWRPEVLVLFGNTEKAVYSAKEKEAIAEYLALGGTLFVAVCPENCAPSGDLLKDYGMELLSSASPMALKAVAPVLRDVLVEGTAQVRIAEMSREWHPMVVAAEDEDVAVMAFRRVGAGKLFCVPHQMIGIAGKEDDGHIRRGRNSAWWSELILACAADARRRKTATRDGCAANGDLVK